MPSCKDICEAKAARVYEEEPDFEEDYSRVTKEEDRDSTRRRKTKYDSYNFMGGYVASGMPGVCTAASSCLSGSSANRLPPGLPPYMSYHQGASAADSNAENRPRLHYDLEPILMDLYAVAAKPQKGGNDREITKVIDVTSNANILSRNNQDIFTTPPRAGGFVKTYQPQEPSHMASFDVCQKCASIYEAEVKHSLSKRSNPSLMSTGDTIHPSMRGTMSREFRIKRALEESDWETTVVDETDTVVGITDPFHRGMNMLAVTITCVMMMSSKMNVTKEYLNWAEGYLKCIKDENGKLPRNINGLLKEIKRRKGKIQDKEEKEQAHRKDDESDSLSSLDKSGKKGKKGPPKGKAPPSKIPEPKPDPKSAASKIPDAKGLADMKSPDPKNSKNKSPAGTVSETKTASPPKAVATPSRTSKKASKQSVGPATAGTTGTTASKSSTESKK